MIDQSGSRMLEVGLRALDIALSRVDATRLRQWVRAGRMGFSAARIVIQGVAPAFDQTPRRAILRRSALAPAQRATKIAHRRIALLRPLAPVPRVGPEKLKKISLGPPLSAYSNSVPARGAVTKMVALANRLGHQVLQKQAFGRPKLENGNASPQDLAPARPLGFLQFSGSFAGEPGVSGQSALLRRGADDVARPGGSPRQNEAFTTFAKRYPKAAAPSRVGVTRQIAPINRPSMTPRQTFAASTQLYEDTSRGASKGGGKDALRSFGERLTRQALLPPAAANGFDTRLGPDWYAVGSLW